MNSKSIISKAIRYFTNSDYRFTINSIRFGMYKNMPDDEYLKRLFRQQMGYELDLDNPKTLNEKLQWLKLYDRNPSYTTMVDKYEVKKYVADIIGEEHLIPTLGIWNTFDEIDFTGLPHQFVLKCTHDSGGLVICRNKQRLDLAKARKKINKSLQRNYYYWGREWPYKNVKPRVLAEQYMEDETGELTDYKFYCFNGKADSVLTCYERNTGDTKFYFFDRNWHLKRYNKRGKEAPAGFTKPRPENLNKMFELAEILAMNSEAPYIRVDMYNVQGQIYFGELTLYPMSGFDLDRLPETDKLFGDMVDLKGRSKRT